MSYKLKDNVVYSDVKDLDQVIKTYFSDCSNFSFDYNIHILTLNWSSYPKI